MVEVVEKFILRIVGVCGVDDCLDVVIDLLDVFECFEVVDIGWYVYVDEGEGKWVIFIESVLDFGDVFFVLEG